MGNGKKRNQHHVTLHPADQDRLEEFCSVTGRKEATTIRDIVHEAISGVLVRKESLREFMDMT